MPGLVVYRYDSPLFFANADDFLGRAHGRRCARTEPSREWFVLNAEANVEVDLTAVDTLEQLRAHTRRAQGIVFAMARVKMDLRDQLAAAGFVDRVGEDRIFATLPTAVAAFATWHKATYGTLPAGIPEATTGPGPESGPLSRQGSGRTIASSRTAGSRRPVPFRRRRRSPGAGTADGLCSSTAPSR